MSTNAAGLHVIEDARKGKRTGAMIGAWVGFFALAFVLGVSWLIAFIGATVVALSVKASRVIAGQDDTIRYRVWGMTWQVAAGCAAVFAVLTFLGLSDSETSTLGAGVALALPALGYAAYAAKSKGIGGGGTQGF